MFGSPRVEGNIRLSKYILKGNKRGLQVKAEAYLAIRTRYRIPFSATDWNGNCNIQSNDKLDRDGAKEKWFANISCKVEDFDWHNSGVNGHSYNVAGAR
ncbi:hypothetical protein A0256_13290 [Mucilaginibacter sp. PAMC 26640]|nr:hypothetical protein A0256_13290 [Mucilaginibacter sp. PAMC 26640]